MDVFVRRFQNLKHGLNRILGDLSWEEIINEEDTVLIKPNFCTDKLKNGVTTNLNLIRNLADIFSEKAKKVVVGETNSNWNNLERWIHRLDLGCEVINLSKMESRLFDSPFGTLKLPKLVFESKLVNLPVLKTHLLTKLSLGIKNLFGLLQNKDKDRYHGVIHELLPFLFGIVKPDLNVMDATYSMLGRYFGP
jgi:uncharacterized protein (DUF362 family)